MMIPRRSLALAAALALGAAACGDTTPTESAERDGPSASAATIVADDIAFDVTSLDATVGDELAITFDNREDGVAHNLHLEGAAGGDAKTEIEEGPTTQTLAVTFDEAGEFEYLCDVHPQQMRGTITVTP